jgi:hypothetical protein
MTLSLLTLSIMTPSLTLLSITTSSFATVRFVYAECHLLNIIPGVIMEVSRHPILTELVFQSLFMLLLLLLAMGWAVTRQEVACKTALFTLWSLYTLVHLMLYVWKKVIYFCKFFTLRIKEGSFELLALLGWAGLGWAGLGWAGLGWAGLGWLSFA